ncbi:uncharacterized protein F5147DRAFT_819342 [Suillus discolor]|uniref:WD40 repeat-like protein n=1 Tax=Suillus discolor TaxID=1912936 RepID=A0A9P7EXZ7_9AGAM|nr:uncharacterized protein F5147DRAFT_819342 [Suillus discolor]KAG2095308.1 hypothetical protein F5147DRAFT_819342 [Suillus discolor]
MDIDLFIGRLAAGMEEWKIDRRRLVVWTIALSPDGKKVVSGSEDGGVRLWEMDTCKVIVKWMGHTNLKGVLFVCWSGDGQQWDVESGETNLAPIKTGHESVWAIAWTQDGPCQYFMRKLELDIKCIRKKVPSGQDDIIEEPSFPLINERDADEEREGKEAEGRQEEKERMTKFDDWAARQHLEQEVWYLPSACIDDLADLSDQ